MRIAEKFDELKARGEKALVLFVTAGDPALKDLSEILEALQEGGADIIEVGIPFSDPIADGPIIQASSQRALDSGVTPLDVLSALKNARLDVPAITMGYYNTALRTGVGTFARSLADAGISGSIISDLTPEEADQWKEASRLTGLDTIFLVAPTSTDDRIDKVCAASTGFVYAVSRMGVTGSTNSVPPEVQQLVRKIKARTQLPVCVGFGISTPEHVRMVCEVADGAVIGSWLVDYLAKNWNGGKGRGDLVKKISALKKMTRDGQASTHSDR